MDELYAYYKQQVSAVDQTIEKVANLTAAELFDVEFLEKSFLPNLGLNNEGLNEQPAELSQFFGRGLHLWQYPSQLARYLVWLGHNAKTMRSYCEIGCRWGGTFILVNEWLKRIGAPIEFALAIDPIPRTPFIQRYIELSSTPVVYLQDVSTSERVKEYLHIVRPQMVFVDGDHTIEGVMMDHLSVRNFADIIVHHDVNSDSCPATTLFWSYARQAESDFVPFQFVQQYESVQGSYLGIGVLSRKMKLAA